MASPIAKLGHGYDAVFSPNGKYLATMPTSSAAKLFRVGDWRQIATLTGIKYPRFIAFLKSSRLALVAAIQAQAAMYEIPSGKLVRKWKSPHGEFGAKTITPDGEHFVCSEDRVGLCLYAIDSGKLVDKVPIGDGPQHEGCSVRAAEFSPDGKYLCTLWKAFHPKENRMMITIRSWPGRKVLREFAIGLGARECPIRLGKKKSCIYASRGGNGVFGASGIDEVNASTGKITALPLRMPEEVDYFGFQFSVCGTRLIVWHEGNISIRDSRGAKDLNRIDMKPSDRIFAATLSPDREYLAVGTGHIHVWKLPNG